LANALGIPVHISACGVGKAWSTAAQQLFQPILENATSITVRDGLSRERLGLFLPGFACQVTADPAILAGEVFPGKARVPQVERIGLGVMSREDVNSHLLGSDKFSELAWKDLWLDVVTCLVAEKMKVEIFTTGSQQDEHFAMQLFLAAHQRFCDSVSRANCPEGAMELLGTMRRYTLVIATRLHASILANALGISSLGLVWDGKVQSYYDEAALSERCFNLAGLQPANLVHACRSLNHQPFDGTLLAELKDNARENARVILKKDR